MGQQSPNMAQMRFSGFFNNQITSRAWYLMFSACLMLDGPWLMAHDPEGAAPAGLRLRLLRPWTLRLDWRKKSWTISEASRLLGVLRHTEIRPWRFQLVSTIGSRKLSVDI